jgi:hypothetical protein
MMQRRDRARPASNRATTTAKPSPSTNLLELIAVWQASSWSAPDLFTSSGDVCTDVHQHWPIFATTSSASISPALQLEIRKLCH